MASFKFNYVVRNSMRSSFRTSAAALAVLFLIVSSAEAIEVESHWPVNGATNVCTDTLLRISFNSAPRFTNAGKITLADKAGHVVDTLDLSLNNEAGAQPRNISGVTFTNFP